MIIKSILEMFSTSAIENPDQTLFYFSSLQLFIEDFLMTHEISSILLMGLEIYTFLLKYYVN